MASRSQLPPIPTKPGGGWKVLKKAPADLPFPGSALTLRDVLELARGRISVNGDKTYVAVEKALDLTGTLKDIAAKRDVIEKLAARFEAFEALLLAASDAARPAEATAGLTGPYVHLQLGEWLKGSVLAGCNSKVLSDQGIVPSSERTSHCTKECLTGSDPAQCEKDGGVWPGYAKKGAQPVTFTRQALRSLVDAIDARSKALSALQKARQAKTSTLGATVSAQSGATKETWVGQYLVGPAIGITLIEGRNGPSIVEYAAFRLYPFPNPIEERVYLDWRRFAVEIGLGLRTSGIGPEGRYSGLDRGKLPPLLIGATFQPLPFFNVAGGVMLVDEKRSTLPQEAAHLAALPYFGLSGELNLFDLFANGIGAGRAKLKIE